MMAYLEHVSTIRDRLMVPNQPIGGVAELARSTRSRCVPRLAEWTDLAPSNDPVWPKLALANPPLSPIFESGLQLIEKTGFQYFFANCPNSHTLQGFFNPARLLLLLIGSIVLRLKGPVLGQPEMKFYAIRQP